jgi:hypothetical protein
MQTEQFKRPEEAAMAEGLNTDADVLSTMKHQPVEMPKLIGRVLCCLNGSAFPLTYRSSMLHYLSLKSSRLSW